MEYQENPEEVPMDDVQYQWSEDPSMAEQPQDIDMAIDPRLYGDAFVPWVDEPLQYTPPTVPPPLVNHHPMFQEPFDFEETFSNSENEGIWSDEEEAK